MAQTAAVVRATLPSVAAGTTDFTEAGFGTPSAAIIFVCNANATNNPQTSAVIGVGFWDGTNQRAVGVVCGDNGATTETYRSSDDSYGAIVESADAPFSAFAVSAVTDGIRLTMSVDNTTVGFFCTVLLLSGISAKALTFTPNGTQDATAVSASLGFAPTTVFFACIGTAAVDTASSTGGTISFGVAKSDGTHRMVAFNSASGAADEAAVQLYSETRCVAQLTTVTLWTGEVTTFGADTFTMTSRDGAPGTDVCFAIALGGDVSLDIGTLTTLTSNGDQVVPTDVAADALLIVLSNATGTSLETGSGANGFMIGLADGNGQFCHNMSVEDAAATTNTNSVAQAAKVLDLDSSSGGARTDLCDATVALNSADFTLTYTATNASARKGWWVAFGQVPAAAMAEPRMPQLNIGAGFVGSDSHIGM